MDPTELIREIQEAFQGVKLENGVSLNMAACIDSGGYNAEQFMRLAKDDERNNWQIIDDKTLGKFSHVFSFTDWKGFRFYLPAYMISTIKHPDGPVNHDFTIYALDPNSISKLYKKPFAEILNKQQIKAVVNFLEYCVEVLGWKNCDAKSAATNLKRMRKYLPTEDN
jgi:hypothetical protein